MKCPSCRASHICTTTTRQVNELSVLRIRKCSICGHTWITKEQQQIGASLHWHKGIPQIVLADG
jgi:transcriptional regulator NrdR family protein